MQRVYKRRICMDEPSAKASSQWWQRFAQCRRVGAPLHHQHVERLPMKGNEHAQCGIARSHREGRSDPNDHKHCVNNTSVYLGISVPPQ